MSKDQPFLYCKITEVPPFASIPVALDEFLRDGYYMNHSTISSQMQVLIDIHISSEGLTVG